jgi:carbonic anhydrase/acetyltransferase-like protein (isoleucine patch superfamily)
MIVIHNNKSPQIDPSVYVAPNATICGDVTIRRGSRIMFGACVVAEGQPLKIGENCIVMENAIIRTTDEHPTIIGSHSLIGPHAHVVGCTLEECCFIATGVSVFHGAYLGYASEVRVGAVVHLHSRLPAHSTVPIGWIAVGDPAEIFPPDQHEAIWKIQKPLNFPKFVYGVERAAKVESNMREITRRRSGALRSHMDDTIVKE